jgi:hypothetical protein
VRLTYSYQIWWFTVRQAYQESQTEHRGWRYCLALLLWSSPELLFRWFPIRLKQWAYGNYFISPTWREDQDY